MRSPKGVMKRVLYRDLGRMGYSECWALQLSEFERMLDSKRGADYQALKSDGSAFMGKLLLVEHDHVYTLGKSGKQQKGAAFELFSHFSSPHHSLSQTPHLCNCIFQILCYNIKNST